MRFFYCWHVLSYLIFVKCCVVLSVIYFMSCNLLVETVIRDLNTDVLYTLQMVLD